MGCSYSIYFENLTVTGAITLAAVRPPTDRCVKLVRAWLGQNGTATSKNLAISIGTKGSAYPTLTSFTPKKIDGLSPASAIVGGTGLAAGTAGINASAEGAGTFTSIVSDVFNNLNGWLWVSGPREIIRIPASSTDGLVMKFLEAPSVGYQDGWYGGLIFEED